jgi:hypothetical protein
MFYRTLLPFQEHRPGTIKPPAMARLGGFQHAVSHAELANSHLNLLMFRNAKSYSLEQLDYNRKRQVKIAAKHFVIRPVAEIGEFKEQAYPAYLSFFERTGYQHGSRRREKSFFGLWADKLFETPKTVILGGYRNGRLVGISISQRLAETLYYEMFFCDTESLRLGLSDFMLHFVRESVVKFGCADQIYIGVYTGGKGVNGFYLLRGCEVVKQPALLRLSALATLLLTKLAPGQYARLKGEISNAAGENEKFALETLPGAEHKKERKTAELT